MLILFKIKEKNILTIIFLFKLREGVLLHLLFIKFKRKTGCYTYYLLKFRGRHIVVVTRY